MRISGYAVAQVPRVVEPLFKGRDSQGASPTTRQFDLTLCGMDLGAMSYWVLTEAIYIWSSIITSNYALRWSPLLHMFKYQEGQGALFNFWLRGLLSLFLSKFLMFIGVYCAQKERVPSKGNKRKSVPRPFWIVYFAVYRALLWPKLLSRKLYTFKHPLTYSSDWALSSSIPSEDVVAMLHKSGHCGRKTVTPGRSPL